MYAPQAADRTALDDILDCPFRELGLLETTWDDDRRYRFVIGGKPTLTPEIIAYACFDYLAVIDPKASTSTISRLANTPGSPGKVFRLTEDAVGTALETYCQGPHEVQLVNTAGVVQLSLPKPAATLAAEALGAYYLDAGHRVQFPVRLGVTAAPSSSFASALPGVR
jgi:hypothetical protein